MNPSNRPTMADAGAGNLSPPNAEPGNAPLDIAAPVIADPALAAVITGWPTLPEPVKAGILAMIRATSGYATNANLG